LRVSPRLVTPLTRKRISPQSFSRETLFRRMAAGDISLFSGLRVIARKYARREPGTLLTHALRRAFPDAERVRVFTGEASTERYLPMSTVIDRWQRGRARIGITDLHIRGTCLERMFDSDALSDFNILPRATEDIAWHEMMTMVVSSRGCVTDSHSDDPDGSNHCFQGHKLWLVWDTFEGQARGLQDVERDSLAHRPRFDLDTFLALRSSRWFVVSPGMTLFLPGDLTHRVVTLEHYLGVGSFYLSIPNCVRTISRWQLHGPLWSPEERESNTPALVGTMARTATQHIRRLRKATPALQRRWGMHFLRQSVRDWQKAVPATTRATLLQAPDFKALVAEARQRGRA
jgi:hypothetical protein